MKFAVIVYEKPSEMSARSDPQRQQAYWGSYGAYNQALKDSGVAAGGTALQPPDTATTIRLHAGKLHVQDGPYADTKEQLGGMFLIDVKNLDEAIAWAQRCPAAAHSAVEVRPVLEMA